MTSEIEIEGIPKAIPEPPQIKRTAAQEWVDTETRAWSRVVHGVVYYCLDCPFVSVNDFDAMWEHQERFRWRHFLSIDRWLGRGKLKRPVLTEEPDWADAERSELQKWWRLRVKQYMDEGR